MLFSKSLKVLLVLVFVFTFWSGVGQALAATILLDPSAIKAGVGQTFTIMVKTDTEGEAINAAQATIRFPKSILEVVSVDKTGSIFNFWVEEPVISNDDGTITFVGGTAKGISGPSLQIIKLVFKAKGVGTANLDISDAVETASDGKGTNVLSTFKSGTVVVGVSTIPSTAAPVEVPTGAVEAPRPVVRTAVTAKVEPLSPKIKVPLYPDETRWYNRLEGAVALWDLPDDVTEIYTRLSQNKDKVAGDKLSELATGKDFGRLTKEGVWYVRVQFKNNVGFSPFSYYKISVDTTPPEAFSTAIDNSVSDNPTPTVSFDTRDSLSGIDRYVILVDGERLFETASTTVKLPPQLPGKHILGVRAYDRAGNSVEDVVDFEILPIEIPTIDFLTGSVSQGEFVFMSGSAISGGFIEVRVFNQAGELAILKTSNADNDGRWELAIRDSLPHGAYKVKVIARDSRGASSLSALGNFAVTAKVVLSLGFIEFGWFEIFIILLLLVVSISSFLGWHFLRTGEMRDAYQIITGRDVDKMGNLLESNLQDLKKTLNASGLKNASMTEAKAIIGKMLEIIGKMKKYLGQEVKKINK